MKLAEKTRRKEVREAMLVHDKNGDLVGEVKAVYKGVSPTAQIPDVIITRQHIDKLVNRSTDFPLPLYSELYREGFAVIWRGFLNKPDLIMKLSQVRDFGFEAVYLDVSVDELQRLC